MSTTFSTANTLHGSHESEELNHEPMPVVRLLQDVRELTNNLFDLASKTMADLQRANRKRERGGRRPDETLLLEQEEFLSGRLARSSDLDHLIEDMLRSDFKALSLVWGNGAGRPFLSFREFDDERSTVLTHSRSRRQIAAGRDDGAHECRKPSPNHPR